MNEWLSRNLREYRHNPCLMRPLVTLLVLIGTLLSLTLLLFRFPIFLFGFLLTPISNRFSWIVQFLYPLGIGRWLHLFGLKYALLRHNASNNTANRGHHSRCAETRFEIVPQRVYVHPLPQLMDNLGYLILCIPPPRLVVTTPTLGSTTVRVETTTTTTSSSHPSYAAAGSSSIVGLLVDVGDATAVMEQVETIEKEFYDGRSIHIQSILSTHKHHDHTAGNEQMLRERDSVQWVMGGAIEHVPACNYPLANGDTIPLPTSGTNNDMGTLVEMEAIAAPAHTRGSLTYALRSRHGCCCLFTGDTMFSAGGGVPFEADMDSSQEQTFPKMTANSYIRASAAAYAVERCFAEVLFRSERPGGVESDQMLMFPGHEYTTELLSRQLNPSNSQPSCRWKNLVPAAFFETASQFYVMNHRRTLPTNNGRLMTVPSSLPRELSINPHFRSMKLRAETVLNAIQLWYTKFASESVMADPGPAFPTTAVSLQRPTSNQNQWTLNSTDVNRSIFTTIYSSDLDQVIEDLRQGRVDAAEAAKRLEILKASLKKHVIGRRPIPGTIPSSRAVYRGLLGFVLLGSAPTALCHSDSTTMNLPPPLEASSTDRIEIDKHRLIAVLHWLGFLNETNGKELVAMIHLLWKETNAYIGGSKSTLEQYRTDVEWAPNHSSDRVRLGALKWVIYGIPEQRPTSALSYCLPCLAPDDDMPKRPHMAAHYSRQSGELVRHDIYSCKLCRDATGCAAVQVQEVDADTERPVIQTISSVSRLNNSDDQDDEQGEQEEAFIEVTTEIHGATVQDTL